MAWVVPSMTVPDAVMAGRGLSGEIRHQELPPEVVYPGAVSGMSKTMVVPGLELA